MTRTISAGGVFPSANSGHDRVDDLHAVVPARLESTVGFATSPNIVPFLRPGTGDHRRSKPALVLPPDLVRTPVRSTAERARLAAYVLLSLLVHGSLVGLLWRDPPPLASIGVEVISVELVLGATAPAGIAPTPGENEVQSAPAETQPVESETPAEKATEQPQDVKVAEKEAAPEVRPQEHPAADNQAAVVPDAPPSAAQPAVAMMPTPQFETPTATPQDKPAPSEQFSMRPQPQETAPERTADQPRPKQETKKAAAPKPVKEVVSAKERRRIAAPTRDTRSDGAKASTPSSQANNVGLGRSSNDTNYRGLVAAHLARYKQYPSDARSRGDGGTASVSFTIGGSGGVTSVRLARGSGIASIDAEVQAMVRRASPFPSPPGGRPQSFTVPVSFRLN